MIWVMLLSILDLRESILSAFSQLGDIVSQKITKFALSIADSKI